MTYVLPATRWPCQRRAFEGTIAAINRGVRRLCVTSPTGTGKTLCAVDLIGWAKDRGWLVAWYAHRKLLLSQTGKVFADNEVAYGVRAAEYEPAFFHDVQICSTQTERSRVLDREERDIHPAHLVIVDEPHAQRGDALAALLEKHYALGAVLVAYTATPLDLGDMVDELLVAGTVSDGRACGALVPAITYGCDEPDLRHIRKYVVGVDLSEADNAKAIMRPGVFGRVKSAWLAHNPEQKPTILFAPDVAGSLFFAEQLSKSGIRSAHIDGSDVWLDGEFHPTDQIVRDRVAALSKAGEVKIVCNRFVLREGIDWPWIECGVFATVFGALTSFLQSGGRLLRASPGKSAAIILDHGGNWHRGFGSLNDDREWTFGMTNHRVVGEAIERRREKSMSEEICCPQCQRIRRGGRTCPYCGFTAHKKSRAVIQIDGALRMVEGDIYKPHRVTMERNTAELWKGIYYGQKRAGKTFRAAEAWFFQKHHYWPPRDLPLMPQSKDDWWLPINMVPMESLIQPAERPQPLLR